MNRLGYLIGTSALAITLGAGFEAQAQNAMLTPPPTDYSVDGRGVDLLTGRPVRNTSLVSIGQPGAGGLSYDRTYVSGTWRDNVTGTMTATGANRSILSVSIGGVTDVFTQSGTTYTLSRNVGQTLSLSGSVYTYRTSDGYCGAAMIQNTGKGGAYRYYSCSRRMKEGRMSCRGVRIPMNRLDETVTHQVAERVLNPERLRNMLEDYVRTSAQRDGDARERLSRLRQQHKEAETSITRLLQLGEQGVMEAEDAALRERLVALRFQRDELARDITDMNRRLASAEPVLTDDKVRRAAVLLREQLHDGPIDLRKDYARMLIGEVAVTDEDIRISGPKDALARFAGEPGGSMPPQVLSSVREWRTRQDSNL